jgi:hypothetical protein
VKIIQQYEEINIFSSLKSARKSKLNSNSKEENKSPIIYESKEARGRDRSSEFLEKIHTVASPILAQK